MKYCNLVLRNGIIESPLKIIILTLSVILFVPAGFAQRQTVTKYDAVNGAIVGNNTGRYNNRPLYINNTDAFVLTGDQPIARLARGEYIFGTFMVGIKRNQRVEWLQNCDQIIFVYRPGRMLWKITDNAFPGMEVELTVLPMAATTGMAVRASATGAYPGDQLVWAFGGAQYRKGQNLAWRLDVTGYPELLHWGFGPDSCRNNLIDFRDTTFLVSLEDTYPDKNKYFTVAGNCSSPVKTYVGDAIQWNNYSELNKSKDPHLPLLNGTVSLENNKPVYWAFEAFIYPEIVYMSRSSDPLTAFNDGMKRTESFDNRLKISTPDPYLDAVAMASVAAVDGAWRPPVFVHGAMRWSVPFPGWRSIFGGTMYGWHDRVITEAKYYTDSQIKTSDKKEPKADHARLLTEQHPDSRFYGVGHIVKDQAFYNMQTQFFDQIVEEYRWTNDPELVSFFREALELHLIWVRDCFDPDGDGVYESYINVWPTDSQWYNGGGTAEETSYAYRGHLAARDMARQAGDEDAVRYHNEMLENIRKGFFEKLWIKSRGHSASYIEQGGHERLHKNPWLYSIFLPVDAGLTSKIQSIESVYYSEWALQNQYMPAGGKQVWTSNWVPGIWSVRELWPGDNYHLALSYIQAGLPDKAWEITRGAFMQTAYNNITPGNLAGNQGGIDFADCVPTFTRTLVSGMFGYWPDYPNGKVKIAPGLPTDWDHASIELPDVKIAYKSDGNKYDYTIELVRPALMELELPVSCRDIKRVMVNGRESNWRIIPCAGRSIVNISLPETDRAEVMIETDDTLPYYTPVKIEGNKGDAVKLDIKDAKITGIEDPQGILDNEKFEGGMLNAVLTGEKGHHTFIARVISGKAPQLRVFRVMINDPEKDALEKARIIKDVPYYASWENIEISSLFNADVTAIFKQEYLTPRPNTVSVRLGTDGYSPWTFTHWDSHPPEIKTDNVDNMLDEQNRLLTPQGVPFLWNNGQSNIAFTSMWDNYPASIDFPVNKKGEAVWFLICGSTNVMQCDIANAILKLNYEGGQTDTLELIPPENYWNLCPITPHPNTAGQDSRTYYTSSIDRFCMPEQYPETVELGQNCMAMVLNLKMRRGKELKSITMETLSQEVVVGLMGMTIMK